MKQIARAISPVVLAIAACAFAIAVHVGFVRGTQTQTQVAGHVFLGFMALCLLVLCPLIGFDGDRKTAVAVLSVIGLLFVCAAMPDHVWVGAHQVF